MFESKRFMWFQLEWYMQKKDYHNIALVLRALADRFTAEREFDMAAELTDMALSMDAQCIPVAVQQPFAPGDPNGGV